MCLIFNFARSHDIQSQNRSFRTLFCPHCTVVTVRLLGIKNRLGSSVSSRSLLITYLVTLCQEKETIVLERKSEKSLEFWTPKSARTLSYLQDLWRKEVFRKLDHLIHVSESVTLSGLKTKNRRTLQ